MQESKAESFGEVLRRHRLATGLSQGELAERADMSLRGVSDLERGARTRPRRDTVQLLSDALQLSPADAQHFRDAARGYTLPVGPDSDRSNNLPDAPTPFIGRHREIEQIAGLLRDPRIRMVTLTGPGGSGKTRLALQVGATLIHDFPDGVFFVSLVPLVDPTLVPSATLDALSVREKAGQEPLQTLTEYLAGKRLLLILDNFEHLLGAASVVARLLDVCRHLHLLITSRIPLHISREHEHAVPPLQVPGPALVSDAARLMQYESAALFIDRARAADDAFSLTDEDARAVREICARLDGLPLAIELAAARIKLFPPRALLPRLSSRLNLLTGGPRDRPGRQQSLRGTLDWSYLLLSAEEQVLFARLSVFAGSCTFEAIEAICDPEGNLDLLEAVSSLVDKSLLRQEGREESRFSMLETVREYAVEKLDQREETERIQDAHAHFFLEMALAARQALSGPQQRAWLLRLDLELASIRQALTHLLARREIDKALTLASALYRFWRARGYLTEGQAWLETGLEQSNGVDASVRAEAMWNLGWFMIEQWDYERASILHTAALSLFRELGHKEGIVHALLGLNYIATWQGDYEAAARLAEESLALSQEMGYRRGLAWSLLSLGVVDSFRGDLERSHDLFLEALREYRALGDVGYIAMLLNNLAKDAQLQGELDEAIRWCDEGLELAHELGWNDTLSYLLATRGAIARNQGEYERADALFCDSLRLSRRSGHISRSVLTLHEQAMVAIGQGDSMRAVCLKTAEIGLRERLGLPAPAVYKAEGEETQARAREMLSDEEFRRAYDQGRVMNLDEAIAFALRGSD